MPRNLIGAPVTSLMLSAAPPRASPSSLVRITPLRSSRSWKDLAVRHRVLADHRVDDEEDVGRAGAELDLLELLHQRLVDGQPSGGVEEHHVAALLAGRTRMARSQMPGGSRRRPRSRPAA